MKSLCIKTNNSEVQSYLLNELNYIDEFPNICFCCKKFKHYDNIIIHYSGKKPDDFYKKISYILSFMIIDIMEEKIFNNLILKNYFYFDVDERRNILKICFDLISENSNQISNKKFDVLYSCIYLYLITNKAIFLNGFINFRIKDYINILDDIISESVNIFIVEKEYHEFISLLKLFVNSQKSTIDTVHLIYSNENSFLLDEYKNIIKLPDDIFKAKYLSDITFSANDYILNSLLNLIPNRIYIHLINATIDEFINTLQLIFDNRIILCTDCSICNLYKKTNMSLKKS